MKSLHNRFFENAIVIGIGNVARGDDGLGWAFLDKLPHDNKIYRYQLSLEDAELISHYDKVIFVDASTNHWLAGYRYYPISPREDALSFSHHVPPDILLHLCIDLFGNLPEAWMIEIEGKNYGLGKGLSSFGKLNLNKAMHHVHNLGYAVQDNH